MGDGGGGGLIYLHTICMCLSFRNLLHRGGTPIPGPTMLLACPSAPQAHIHTGAGRHYLRSGEMRGIDFYARTSGFHVSVLYAWRCTGVIRAYCIVSLGAFFFLLKEMVPLCSGCKYE